MREGNKGGRVKNWVTIVLRLEPSEAAWNG
jgi:hypothetical protein